MTLRTRGDVPPNPAVNADVRGTFVLLVAAVAARRLANSLGRRSDDAETTGGICS